MKKTNKTPVHKCGCTVKILETKVKDTMYDPACNPKAISIIQQEDGNWKGWTQRFGTLVEVREVSPNDCLVKLLTHDGK